ncbi:hypothetical protein [Novosphingobium sp.]|uniref:hypothetical protein n=1 Tax=Novosphingobium sp. TaxID=1874826 RepID=UPI001D43B819|nr:hypothetical protein [Novosphingobium sp.]MBX9662891.1 hypothetical protein [Novosphingobium sp.]
MHTVRNRLASRPPAAMPHAAGNRAPNHAAMRHELAYIQRGSMAVPLVIPDESGLIEERPQKRRNAKGKKARKAAARLAAARAAPTPGAAACDAREAPPRAKPVGKKGKVKSKARAKVGRSAAARPEQLPAIPAASPVMGTYSPPAKRIAAPAVSALPLPVCPEPLVEEAPAPIAPMEAAKPVLLLPAPEPLIEAPVLPAEPEAAPAPDPEPATASADAPLPRMRALVPARRQGLIDVIAFFLRDSGRRLARWSARRHKTREEQAKLRRAEARQINLQRELEALDALRRAKG